MQHPWNCMPHCLFMFVRYQYQRISLGHSVENLFGDRQTKRPSHHTHTHTDMAGLRAVGWQWRIQWFQCNMQRVKTLYCSLRAAGIHHASELSATQTLNKQGPTKQLSISGVMQRHCLLSAHSRSQGWLRSASTVQSAALHIPETAGTGIWNTLILGLTWDLRFSWRWVWRRRSSGFWRRVDS
jgi:hypothetical protein